MDSRHVLGMVDLLIERKCIEEAVDPSYVLYHGHIGVETAASNKRLG
jgi:hypothetical protein